MKIFRALTLGLLLVSPVLASADTAPPAGATEAGATKDARLVPLMKDGTFVGLKVYAIRAGGRFDQPTARFMPGDTIVTVDGVPVIEDAGAHALYDKVIRGTGDATVVVERKGGQVKLESKAH